MKHPFVSTRKEPMGVAQKATRSQRIGMRGRLDILRGSWSRRRGPTLTPRGGRMERR